MCFLISLITRLRGFEKLVGLLYSRNIKDDTKWHFENLQRVQFRCNSQFYYNRYNCLKESTHNCQKKTVNSNINCDEFWVLISHRDNFKQFSLVVGLHSCCVRHCVGVFIGASFLCVWYVCMWERERGMVSMRQMVLSNVRHIEEECRKCQKGKNKSFLQIAA